MKKIVWNVRCGPPAVLRHCRGCGFKTEYICSGRFRINAQRKHLDIWLIYRCSRCGATWNLPIYSRVRPASVAPDLLGRYHSNDSGLALRHALDMGLLRANGAAVRTPVLTIDGEDLPPDESAELHLACPYPLNVTVSSILRQKLSLSRRRLEQLIENGTLKGTSGADLMRQKLSGTVIVTVNGSVTGL